MGWGRGDKEVVGGSVGMRGNIGLLPENGHFCDFLSFFTECGAHG